MQEFWKHKRLEQMTQQEWESLCDGCALCCLHKLEDEDTDEVYYTDVYCQYLNKSDCHCSVYAKRSSLVPQCVWLDAKSAQQFQWLPETCAYRLLANKQPLYDWHPLISGSKDSVHQAGISMRHKGGIADNQISPDQWESRIICKAC